MNQSELLLLATICFVAMISPGPDFLLVTKNALLYSKRTALATAYGIVCGCLVHATYCVLGLAIILTQSVVLFSTIKFAGALYLIYLGLKGITAKAEPRQGALAASMDVPRDLTPRRAFMQGFLCNVLNPKLAIFLLSLFTQFIAVDASIQEKVTVAGVFLLEAFIYWPTLTLALQARQIKSAFARTQHVLDRVCGALLIYLGVRVAVQPN